MPNSGIAPSTEMKKMLTMFLHFYRFYMLALPQESAGEFSPFT